MSTDFPTKRRTVNPIDHRRDAEAIIRIKNWKKPKKVDLTVEIDQLKDEYFVTLSDGWQFRKKNKTGLSVADIKSAYNELRNAEEVLLFGGRSLNNRMLLEIAEAGYFLFSQLFSNRKIIEKFRNTILEPAASDPLYILVNSERCIIPWSLLYIEKPAQDDIDITKFVGNRCAVVVDISDPEDVADEPPARFPPRFSVVGAHCDTLKYSSRLEMPFIKELAQLSSQTTDFYELRPLVSVNGKSSPREDKAARDALFREDAGIIHFACHGFHENSAGRIHFQVRDHYPLSYSAIKTETDKFNNNPLVFLNACEVGFVDPASFAGLVRFFLDRGARAVIAPDCKIPDREAYRFSSMFYKNFARGDTVVDAFFRARREMVLTQNSFIGFAYTIFGKPHARCGKETANDP